MIAISRRHSSSQQKSMPRYGNMQMGASPAKRLGGRASAGRNADLNSSHGDDHSTSRRGGSGHWATLSGMVSTVFIGLGVYAPRWFKQPRYEEAARKKYLRGRRARSGTRGRRQWEVQARKRRRRERRPDARA